MSINRVLSQGKGAMAANQLGLATSSHNIANANTKGYSRQRVDFESNEPVTNGSHRLGTGVLVGKVSRSTNHFVNKRLEEESSDLGKFSALNETYVQLEADLGSESESGVSTRMSQFFNDLRSLATEPSSIPLRSAVRESAESVVSRFQNISNNLKGMKDDFDRRIESSVAEVNSLTNKIAGLNQRIVDIEVNKGSFANDERDRRDVAVKELSALIPVDVTDLENGGIAVSSKRVGLLVDVSSNYELATVREADDVLDSTVRIRTKEADGSLGKDVTRHLNNGAIGGLIESRDKVMPMVKERMDTLAFGFAKSLNSLHQQGYSLDGQTGNEFFSLEGGVKDAASLIKVSDAVKNDLTKISAGEARGAKGDNRTLMAMADLEDQKIFENGEANFTDYLTSMIGNVGVESRSVMDSMETQIGVMNQLETLREETSGVSLDEEAVDMLKFQKAFNANAKLIQVADSMMETVLSLKRF
ncbi:flagellar hook-associated protein FlgK [bacterium]|nr:flagellar hook-associated protein FlgK [bacterium]